jgi:hypothetical protein
MPWRLKFFQSPSGIFGVYPLRARYRAKLDIGFFNALQTTHHRTPIRGPPNLLPARVE